MINFKQSSYVRELPGINLIPLLDILFVILSFFMAMFLHFNFESALDISVPRAAEAKEAAALSQEIIVNIDRDGDVAVGQKKLSLDELVSLLRRASELSARQPVVIRADQKTYHERVVSVLDACARAGIWNISFATTRE